MRKKVMVLAVLMVSIGWLGSSALAQPPVRTGLVFWLDASNTGSLTLSDDKVARWNDLSGAGNYADQTAAAQQPTYLASGLNGKGIVDFGDSVYGNPLTTYQPWMQFRNASGTALNISNVRTVFWVCGMDAGSNGFLLGDDNNYHFHRGQQNQIWDGANGWASANIRNGSTYLNGVKVDGTATVLPTAYSIISLVTTGNVETSMLTRDRTYRSGGIKLGELLIYSTALTDAERISVEAYLHTKWFFPGNASVLEPQNAATDLPREVVLSWTAGRFAKTHDVYLGTVYADVNDASRTNPKRTLVSQGQSDTTYDAGRLEFGQTYYWRVDEVNAPPDSTIFRGPVWSFTVEPYSYPIPNVTAMASSASTPETGAQKTVDGSGMSGDQHGTTLTDMWLSNKSGPEGAWIQFAFDKTYKLDRLLVWNSNQILEVLLGFGAKNVSVEYSTDDTNWKKLGDFEFARAPAAAGYTPNTTVDFAGAMAKYVKLTITSNWGGILAQYGLSEVRFLYIPVAAREPAPASGATGVTPQVTLSWRPGREAVSHQVFLGTDANDLAPAATTQEPRYEADVNLDQTYYWKVVEVNEAEDPAAWQGDLWSFSTVKFFTVDDFETYTDNMDKGQAIFQTWIDGYEVQANGSQVGYGQAPFAETQIVQGGKQAMPLAYANTAGATYSEAERTFDAPQDWTLHGYKGLALSFYGDPNNTGQMYLKINNTKVLYSGKAEDIKRTQWQPWNIDLASTGANLKNVTKLALGVDGAGAAGTLYIDNIRLYASAGEMITPVDPGATGLAAWYKFDGDFKDSAGTHPATAKGDAKIVSDPVRGQVVALDGIGDAVDVPLLGSGNALTIAMWVNTAVDPVPIQFESFFHADGWEVADLHWRYSYGKVDSGINGVAGGNLTGTSILKANQWNHVAVTVSPTEWALWLNGLKEASRALPMPATVTLGDGLIGAWLGTDGTTVSRNFTGRIDEVRFYNRALSPEEIASLAGRTAPFPKPFE
jgi:hypothetical protein